MGAADGAACARNAMSKSKIFMSTYQLGYLQLGYLQLGSHAIYE